jgi:hypothetical protein
MALEDWIKLTPSELIKLRHSLGGGTPDAFTVDRILEQKIAEREAEGSERAAVSSEKLVASTDKLVGDPSTRRCDMVARRRHVPPGRICRSGRDRQNCSWGSLMGLEDA